MLTLLLALNACPTETPEEVAPLLGPPGGDGAGGAPGAPPPGGEAPGSPPPGGQPNTPPTPGGGAPTALVVVPGEGVKVSGTASYVGTPEGTIRLDVLRKSDTISELVYSGTLGALGPFDVELPKNIGSIQVAVFIDLTGDGPTVGEPMAATTWIDVGDKPVTDLKLVLNKLENGGPPPAGGTPVGAPPGGGAAPGGAPPAGAPPGGGAPPAGAPPAR
ncbi:MAG: hypothetical protein EXR71_07355 [Myxococcales bacterium]|nr:hypothetical protein [Myxococcales bacterium]